MHGNRAIAVVEPWSLRTWAALGAAAVAAPLALTIPAAGLFDVVLIGVAALSAGGTWWAISVRRWIDGLPLEIAPVAGTGIVDGARVYRFRARLGRGRVLRDPTASVSFVGEDGATRTLDVDVPKGRLLGPFTVLARDPIGPFGAPGEFRIGVAARGGGTEWRAERRIGSAEVREGWFGGVAAHDWNAVNRGQG